jgi:hypothetical protein
VAGLGGKRLRYLELIPHLRSEMWGTRRAASIRQLSTALSSPLRPTNRWLAGANRLAASNSVLKLSVAMIKIELIP